jgi:hypothetical protein
MLRYLFLLSCLSIGGAAFAQSVGSVRLVSSDGKTFVTIKAASTAVAAADPALAVSLSPNSPLPAGANALGSVTVTGTVTTTTGGNGTVVAGQASVTTSAAALAANSTKELCVRALIGNTDVIYVGPSGVTTSTGYPLYAGDGVCAHPSNSNLVFAISASGTQNAAFVGTN